MRHVGDAQCSFRFFSQNVVKWRRKQSHHEGEEAHGKKGERSENQDRSQNKDDSGVGAHRGENSRVHEGPKPGHQCVDHEGEENHCR